MIPLFLLFISIPLLTFANIAEVSSSDAIDFTEEDVIALVHEWYVLLDEHADVYELEDLMAKEDIFFSFPEANLTSIAEFESWFCSKTVFVYLRIEVL